MKLIKLFLVTFLILANGCTSPAPDNSKDSQASEDVVVEDEVIADDDAGGADSNDPDTSIDATDSAAEDSGTSPITWTECSGKPGEKACDFTFLDQNGDSWSLYDHHGTVMVIDFSTMWCYVCKNIAGDAQVHQDSYTDQGYDFLWVTVLVDDATSGNPPEADDIQSWVNTYGMTTSPVLAGDRSVIDLTAEDGYPISAWPTLVVIDETLTIHNGLLGWNEETVFGWVDEVLGIVR